jgi:hypothetical protein
MGRGERWIGDGRYRCRREEQGWEMGGWAGRSTV